MFEKNLVKKFWNEAACGERMFLDSMDSKGFNKHAQSRYELEPYIIEFAEFDNFKEKTVLEIGLGLGADHEKFSLSGADLYGVDITPRAVEITKKRLKMANLPDKVTVGDAEDLHFPNSTFDLVYSWGVIHHTPNTKKAATEILRVLKPQGKFKVMIYHKYSFVGLMLWIRYAFFRGRFFVSLDEIYANYLESPGTKAYSIKEARDLFEGASNINIKVVLSHGDLLASEAGQRHNGLFLNCARKIWPRKLISICFKKYGLFMLIDGQK